MRSENLNPTSLFNLQDKVIIVTGGNRGNGFGISRGLVDAGAAVIRIDKHFTSSLASDDRVFDLSFFDGIPSLVESIEAQYGKIDGLVNNAGISLSIQNPYSNLAAHQNTMDVNATSAYLLCSSVCNIMAKKGSGSIVNITSLGAKLGFADNPSYQMSKAALSQLTKAIAKDWGEKGIRANNIAPGYILTPMTEKSFNDPIKNQDRKNRTLLKRWGMPSDLIGPVIFLLSDASAYVTGSDVLVDGGWCSNGL
jgi:NAD(P)-dependent dehydrogenase (short-subunit alcohol dehydrogenase family)